MTQIYTTNNIPVYEPHKAQYTVHPGGDLSQRYTSLQFKPVSRPDEILRWKTFHFPDASRLAQEKLLKDQGLDAAVTYLRKNGVSNIELATVKYPTSDGEGSIQILYAEPPSPTLLPSNVDVLLHGRNVTLGNLAVPAIRSYFSGKAICMLSYRGEEGNTGTPYQEALADDLDAAIEFLTKHKRWETERINFMASSLGCDVLANMFYRRHMVHGVKEERFGNATLIAPFRSLYDIAVVSIGRFRIIPRSVEPTTPSLFTYPFRHLIAKLFKRPILSLHDHLPYLSSKLNSVKVFASNSDEYIPVEQSRKVYHRLLELMDKEKVSWTAIPGLSHTELCQMVT